MPSNLFVCDHYGKLQLVAPDGSYSDVTWEMISPATLGDGAKAVPALHNPGKRPPYWMVIDENGNDIGHFRARSDARNFIRHNKKRAS